MKNTNKKGNNNKVQNIAKYILITIILLGMIIPSFSYLIYAIQSI